MKILYNVTIKIESSLHQDWLNWMTSVHIPDVLSTGCFENFRLTRILGDDDEHGVGFAIQYTARDMDTFNIYQQRYAKALQKEHTDRYLNQYIAFRTLMQVEAEGSYIGS